MYKRQVVKGISHGPGLGALDLSFPIGRGRHAGKRAIDTLNWIITEGESRQGRKPREYKLEWAESLAEQASDAGIPFFMKQMGHFPTRAGERVKFTGKGADVREWPKALQRQEFPQGKILVVEPERASRTVLPIISTAP